MGCAHRLGERPRFLRPMSPEGRVAQRSCVAIRSGWHDGEIASGAFPWKRRGICRKRDALLHPNRLLARFMRRVGGQAT
jgi:hypothetical protein